MSQNVLEVIQCCGWRMKVMELFAFCQLITLVSEPPSSLTLPSTSQFMCVLPVAILEKDGLRFKLCLFSYWLNLSQCCMCVCVRTLLFAQVCSVCAFSCMHPRMCGEGKPLCHRAIIPTLAQWPRLNPGFDPPPNLSLQALG